MTYEPIAALSLSIFITVSLFFTMYLVAYSVVHGALFTARKVKVKWNEGRENKYK